MARPAAGRIALLAIKPRYVRAILEGSKRVELRRVAFADDVSVVVIYSTLPDGHIVGWFSVAAIDRLSPSALWERHKHHSGVSRQEFRDYFAGAREAVAIHVGELTVLPTPVPLTLLDEDLRAPQSFMYLEDSALDTLEVHTGLVPLPT